MSLPAIAIVPPTSPPPASPREQRHTPRPANDYSDYRACLRWDAGFICCFCLIHESDLAPAGVEGSALTWIEHIEPRSRAPHLINDYTNCAYSCRYCNNLRGNQPVRHPSGARLLHPWRDAWGEHFRLQEDRLEIRHDGAAGRDARYTEQIYRLNDARRVELRRQRRELITDRIRVLQQDTAALRLLAERQMFPEDRLRVLDTVRKLEKARRHALDELRWRSAIPHDAPTECRCDSREHLTLPPETPVLRPG